MMSNYNVCENISKSMTKSSEETEKHIKWKSMKQTKTTVPYMLEIFSPSWTV